MFYYETSPIDYFAGMVTFDEFCAQIRKEQKSSLNGYVEHYIDDMKKSLEMTKKYFYGSSCWEGDIMEGPYVFTLPDPDFSSSKEGFVWKQRNNGSSFIASPCPIQWLEAYLIGSDEPQPSIKHKDIDTLRYYLTECLSMLDDDITYNTPSANNNDPLYVKCQVSGRRLRFAPDSQMLQGGEFICIDVIASQMNDGKAAKTLCQVIVTREDLLRALSHVHARK